MNYLLDTCVISEGVRRRPDRHVSAWQASIPQERQFLSVLTLGEIQKGISRLNDPTRSNRLKQWLDVDVRRRFAGRVLALDEETLLAWGDLEGAAEKRGRPLPVTDALLAATALVHHLTFVTRDSADFSATGVSVLDPWKVP
ncbi:MAG: PilT domain-containing [Planctomycetota bacterium]|nr:MAG: PilT domain-containing [Planctomycetota bacterium]